MAGVFIEVDTEQMERDVTILRERVIITEELLENVYDSMNELDAMWDGMANSAFNQQFAKDEEYFDQVIWTFALLIDSISDAASNYNKCAEQVQSYIDAIWL